MNGATARLPRLEGDADSERLGEVASRESSLVPLLPPFYVARPRLLDLLDAGADTPLTAVVAPPGSGKSVALAVRVRDRCPDAAWVGCEELDRDPVMFWTKVGSALAPRARANVGSTSVISSATPTPILWSWWTPCSVPWPIDRRFWCWTTCTSLVIPDRSCRGLSSVCPAARGS